MKVLVADALPGSFHAAAQHHGWEVTDSPSTAAESLPDIVAGHDVLVVRSTRVTGETVRAGDRLSLIVRAGAGTNTIDVAAASDAAITVANVPGRNAIAVAELTMGLLMAIDRNIPDNVADLRAAKWDKGRYSQASGLFGRTFGIVGLGAIGREVAQRAAAFGMPLLTVQRPAWSPAAQEAIDRFRITMVPTLGDLAQSADVVSFHVPLTDATRGIIDRGFLRQLRDGAVILNTSRGELVADEEALIDAIEAKGLRAGLDVFHNEPGTSAGTFRSALAQHPSVYGTHHIGASTEQAQEAVAAGVIDVIAGHEAGSPENVVNLNDTAGAATVVVRHRNEIGVLSRVLAEIREAGINVEDMENRIFQGGKGAVARVAVSRVPTPAIQAVIGELPAVIGVSVQEHL